MWKIIKVLLFGFGKISDKNDFSKKSIMNYILLIIIISLFFIIGFILDKYII